MKRKLFSHKNSSCNIQKFVAYTSRFLSTFSSSQSRLKWMRYCSHLINRNDEQRYCCKFCIPYGHGDALKLVKLHHDLIQCDPSTHSISTPQYCPAISIHSEYHQLSFCMTNPYEKLVHFCIRFLATCIDFASWL